MSPSLPDPDFARTVASHQGHRLDPSRRRRAISASDIDSPNEGIDMTKTRIAAIAAAATLGAGALTGATMALAADDTPPPTSSASDSMRGNDERGQGHEGKRGGQGREGERGRHGGHGMGGPRDAGPGHLLHSEGVAEDAEGNYVTVRMQQGEVTAVTATSLSVTSADGYSSTYVINDHTVVERDGEEAAPSLGDTVHVRAIVDGGTATAQHVHALSPERAEELEQQRTAMEKWMAERPEGAGAHGNGGPGRA